MDKGQKDRIMNMVREAIGHDSNALIIVNVEKMYVTVMNGRLGVSEKPKEGEHGNGASLKVHK